MIVSAIAMALIIGTGCLMQYAVYPNGYFPSDSARSVAAVAEIASTRGVRINEVMTSNKTALSDESGAYPDWIELINASNSTVDVSGWALLDKTSRSAYFTFPAYQLEPGETVIIFASGRLQNEPSAEFHAPFRLSSSGDTLMLFDENSSVVESINIPALGANQSYARAENGGWNVTSEYTPGLENTSLNYAHLTSTQPIADSTLIISEIMADNASYPAPDGGLYDWIEITNTGSEAVNLSGYALSDSINRPARWKFSAVMLESGASIVVYASGAISSTDDALYADFKLRAEGESVLLYNPSGQVLDYVEFDNLKTDHSLKRQSDGSYSTSDSPSPGQTN